MKPEQHAVNRLMQALRLDTPLVAIYDAEPSVSFEPFLDAGGRACCFAYYDKWCQGHTVVFRRTEQTFGNPTHGCPGAHNALGLGEGYPTFMANFLTDGVGAPMGEGLKATPELAQEFLDRATSLQLSGDTVLIGPLRLAEWNSVRSITFFADPDRISALMTLAAYWSSDPDLIHAPFSSGCGLMLRELEHHERPRAVLGCTDIAMRKYIPSDILSISVTPEHFSQMLTYPENAFLNKSWWNDLLNARLRSP